MTRMRAVSVAAPGRIELRELPFRDLQPREVRVRLEGERVVLGGRAAHVASGELLVPPRAPAAP